MFLTDEAKNEFSNHVLKEYPTEACGLLVDNEFLPCTNIHNNPEHGFLIDPADVIRLTKNRTLQAVLHSHPYRSTDRFEDGFCPEFPSQRDMEVSNEYQIPFGIASSDGSGISRLVWFNDDEIQPILGRKFVWGSSDCFCLVRDWYRLNKGISFLNVPRSFGWWNQKDAEPIFELWFPKLGFYEIPKHEATIGDVVLMRLGDRYSNGVINHCGVISNHNELTHQANGNSYSQATRLDKWNRSIAKYIRYKYP